MKSKRATHSKPRVGMFEDLVESLVRRASEQRFSIFLVTGTDTGVGKTHVTCVLLEVLRALQVQATGLKPVCCGNRKDAKDLWKASGRSFDLNVINPFHLSKPVAPVAQRGPSWAKILACTCRSIRLMRDRGVRLVLMEGAGGLLCPIAAQHTIRDLAIAVNARVLVVAPDRLGVLNHTLLTLEAAGQLPKEAVILNRFKGRKDASQKTNADLLSRWTHVPVYTLESRAP